jgi:ubiquinone/menaquinone biosynthesis C-methylase UbiE
MQDSIFADSSKSAPGDFFASLSWRDPLSGRRLVPSVTARNPAGKPLYGALVVEATKQAYPIVEGVVMATPELAFQHRDWLAMQGLQPPQSSAGAFQETSTVDSFGFEWTWDASPRTEYDLVWRVAERYGLDRSFYANKLILDAGAGAGDQSRWLLSAGARGVVSVDLSEAISVAAKKLGSHPNWIGIRGDITRLPFEDDRFDFVYCEGVIQHTRDSAVTVRELCRVLRPGAQISATHYSSEGSEAGGWRNVARNAINRTLLRNRRERLSRWDRDKLFLYSGVLAWLGMSPGLGYVLKRLNVVIHNPRIPTFKATWSCTYDAFGNHSYQRHVSSETFLGYFRDSGCRMSTRFQDGNVLLMEKLSA